MKGSELLNALLIMSDKELQRPVLLMEVKEGITYARKITQCFPSEPYDGKIIWILAEEDVEFPKWMK